MKIDNINIYKNITGAHKSTNVDIRSNQLESSAGKTSKADRLELSSLAKSKMTEKTGKNLEVVKQRIADGFYNSEEVLNQVAGLLLKEIKGE